MHTAKALLLKTPNRKHVNIKKEDFAMKVISIANQKGGTAKTTTTWNLAACLSELGKQVLMIDLDPQASLTICQGIEPADLKVSIYNVLSGSVDVNNSVIDLEHYDLIPSTIDLSAAEVELSAKIGKEYVLAKCIRKIAKKYDYVLIDCPPSLGNLTVNSLCASDGIIIPMACEFLAYRGLKLLEDTIKQVKELNPGLSTLGILPTMYDSRTIHSEEVLSEAKKGSISVFNIIIKKSIKFSDSSILAVDITKCASDKFEGKSAYRQLALEVSKHE